MTEYLTADAIREAGRRTCVNKQRFAPSGDVAFCRLEDGGISISLPQLPPSKNSYTRAHWRIQQRTWFKPWEAWVRSGAWWDQDRQEYTLVRPHVSCPFTITVRFTYPDKRRRDVQNYAGYPPLFDTLVTEGVIADDSCPVTWAQPIIAKGTALTIIEIRPDKKGATR